MSNLQLPSQPQKKLDLPDRHIPSACVEVHHIKVYLWSNISLIRLINIAFSAFNTANWASEKQPACKKTEWYCADTVTCLKCKWSTYGRLTADATATQSSPDLLKSKMVYRYLSGTSLPRKRLFLSLILKHYAPATKFHNDLRHCRTTLTFHSLVNWLQTTQWSSLTSGDFRPRIHKPQVLPRRGHQTALLPDPAVSTHS